MLRNVGQPLQSWWKRQTLAMPEPIDESQHKLSFIGCVVQTFERGKDPNLNNGLSVLVVRLKNLMERNLGDIQRWELHSPTVVS